MARDPLRPSHLTVVLAAAASSLGSTCDPPPPTPSDSIVVPYQFNIEFAIEVDGPDDYTARARLYDIVHSYDVTGNAGTIELAGGDSLFADGVELDIETRSTFLNTLRVDYSQSIPTGKDEYLFELRRPDDERIEATIPIPDPFDIAEIGRVEDPRRGTTITWSPVVEGATVDILLEPLDDGCLTVIGGGPTDLARDVKDTGEFEFDTDVYHSPDHDCRYELTLSRRAVAPVRGRWFRDGEELPANDVWAIGLHTVRQTFVAGRRP